jgi:dipeptidyl aminopeptidase/acylaminoacyl peptidase
MEVMRLKKGILAFFLVFLLLTVAQVAYAESVLKAAFIRGGNLWLKIDQNEKQITKEGHAAAPVWSPDGRWVAYSKKDGIWVYDTRNEKNYKVYHEGGSNCQWAPQQDVLAFQDGTILDIVDIRSEKPKSFTNAALGVSSFSWRPDGRGFLTASSANLLPDGWTNPILFTVPLENDLNVQDLTKNVRRFFTIPKHLKKGEEEISSIGTSGFEWSADHKWIAFMVYPTASLAMDSNMVCVLSADGKIFETLDVMASGFPFAWAPSQNLLGYIEGSGRIVFGFKNKNLKVKELPALQSQTLTPKSFVDLNFTWVTNDKLIASRSKSLEWSNEPSKRAMPSLFAIHVSSKNQKQITSPPRGFGDFRPFYVHRNNKLAWTRSNWEKNDVWISKADGTLPMKWIENVDAVSWYDLK